MPYLRTKAGKRVGVLLPVPGNDHFLAALQEQLHEAGWTGDQTIHFEVRRASGTASEFRVHAAELAAMGLDVLVTASTVAAMALVEAARDTSVVFVGTFDPVAAGLVQSLERPGLHATGITGFQADIASAWVSSLREIAPHLSRVHLFFDPESASAPAVRGWSAVASRMVTSNYLQVNGSSDIDRAVHEVAQDDEAGIIVVPHTFAFTHRDAIVAAMAEHRVPAIYGIAEMVRAGGLISYGQDLLHQWSAAAAYVDKILRGSASAELPVQVASRHALAVNRSAAKRLGLVIPDSMLEKADEIVD